ncbi:hypothetical protein [Candidatus Paracaedibacter symbiosus]|uniref:hypothetical protein n=1 Tax=Candidatus Paracaedibacter symbiosus TaxID=244582 RepID=UPI000509B90E|nr:hypothetical protein [Candidatus Paracaedibacter symbiosus]
MRFLPTFSLKPKTSILALSLLLSSVSSQAMQAPSDASSNRLTDDLCFDLSANKYQQPRLELANHPIEDITPLANAFNFNTTVQFLDLSGTSLEKESVETFLTSLHRNKTLKILYLPHNALKDDCIHAIFRLLTKNTCLTDLNLSYNNFSTDAAIKLIDAFPTNTSLTRLNLEGNLDSQGNLINPDVLKKIADLVSGNMPKEPENSSGFWNIFFKKKQEPSDSLDQSKPPLSPVLLDPRGRTWSLKAQSLTEDPLINGFAVYRAHLGDQQFVNKVVEACQIFNDLPLALRQRLPLEMLLNLSFNAPQMNKLAIVYGKSPLKATGIRALSTIISSNTVLQELSFQGQEMGMEGLEDLTRSLRNNNNLEVLRLRGNGLGGKGVMLRLLSLIGRNGTLRMLDLASNGLTDINDTLFFETIFEQGCSLTTLCLDDNYIRDRGVQLLTNGLGHSNNLTELYLANNQIGDEGAKAFANLIASGSKLKILDLSKNLVKDEGAEALAGALPQNPDFEKLYLNKNMIGLAGLEAFVTEWISQQTEIVVALGGNAFEREDVEAAYGRGAQTQKSMDKGKEIEKPDEAEDISSAEEVPSLTLQAEEFIGSLNDDKGTSYNSLTSLKLNGSVGRMSNPNLEEEETEVAYTYGLHILANALAPGGCLEHLQLLDLSHNNITAEGLGVLSEGISLNTSLTSLNLDYNPVFDFLEPNTIGLYSLASAIKDKPVLLENLSIQAPKMSLKYEGIVRKLALKMREQTPALPEENGEGQVEVLQ